MDAIQLLKQLRHSPLHNYIIPGLTSYIVKEYGEDAGMLRLFEMERTQLADIAPHSHRFDFECEVLEGKVTNTIWTPCSEDHAEAEPFIATKLSYLGRPGDYSQVRDAHPRFWRPHPTVYTPGINAVYRMQSDQIHSIRFARGSIVTFKEGPRKTRDTVMLDPWTRGIIAEISPVKDWMFRKGLIA